MKTFQSAILEDKDLFRGPQKSPDLTKLEYFIWGYVKDLVYRITLTTLENMLERLREAFKQLLLQG